MASLSTKNRLCVRAATQLVGQSTVRLFGGHHPTLCATVSTAGIKTISSASKQSPIIVPQPKPTTSNEQQKQQHNTCNPSLQQQQQQRRNYATNPIGLLQASSSSANILIGGSSGVCNSRASRFFDVGRLQVLPQLHPCMRGYSSVHTQQPAGPVREIELDPYIMLDDDIKYVTQDIRDIIEQSTNQPELDTIAKYYFDGQGKALRPMVCMLMARAINYHIHKDNREPMEKQRQVAMISEMIHTASLIHDDVIDQSNYRRGKPSVNVMWNHRKVTMTGDFIVSIVSIMISRLKNDDVTIILSTILTDLIQGEFMQLGSKEGENERFTHYLTKTYRKTASLIANSLKAVAILGGSDEHMTEVAFQYGRNIGLAFQLVDDLLDFVSSADAMGKPTAADLKLGLATAPVLFACEKYPELNPMIMRRFEEPGDVERAFELVHLSQGLEQTRFLARKHCEEAIRLAQQLTESPYQKGLIVVNDFVLNRMK